MGKSIHNDVIDALLNYIKNNATDIKVCSAEPTTYAEANATYMLASIAVTGTDFTVADGDTSGRKVTVASKSGTVTNSGTANHVAIVDSVNSKLLLVTTCTSQSLTASNAITTGSFKDEVADPT